jgi:putative nucleotidyltransferase-like protein
VSLERAHLLIRILQAPEQAATLELRQWETLVHAARRANLLSRVALELERRGLLPRVPAAPRAHLEAARVLADAQAAAVRREVAFVERALGECKLPVVLLKGAAYLIAGLTAARGRMFSDVDILVPAQKLGEVEARLMLHGWSSAKTSAYDQRYYRRWMHELPPLKHNSRQTVLDVHHAILPTTARLKPDSKKLLAAAVPIAVEPNRRVLAPVDMVLHSAAHLFCNEDVGNSLRDLVDLDCLLREYGSAESFWPRLTVRAGELDLKRPLYYALRYACRVLATPIPPEVIRAAEIGRPPSWLRRLMDSLFLRTFQPEPSSERLSSITRLSLYVRAHWLRMPPLLLAHHLTVKAFRREEESAG